MNYRASVGMKDSEMDVTKWFVISIFYAPELLLKWLIIKFCVVYIYCSQYHRDDNKKTTLCYISMLIIQ